MIKLIAISMFLMLWLPSQTQFYNSVAVMEVLLYTQEKIMEHIQKYVRYITDGKRAVVVQRFLSRCRTEHDRAVWDEENYLGNPLNAFALIMRLTRDLDHVERILNETTAGMKYTPDNSLAYPSEEDVTGMVEGMTRLQLMYDLDVMMMANGTLTTFYSSKPVFIEYTAPMTSCDCYELGLIEYHKKDRSRNIAWMKQALRRHEHGLDCPITKVDIYDRLSGDYYYIGEHEAAKYWIERRVDASPTDPQNKKYKEVLNLLQGMEAINKATPISTPRNKEIDLYPGLCLKTYFSLNASLTCYYAHGPHPFLLVAPMKAERLHQSPEILLFHDVITNAEIQDIQALARPRFEQAKATKQDGTRAASENYCVHQVAWLTDVWSNATLRVARRVAQFSGLVVNANTTEEFQVANYGTGGYYGPHYDFIRSNVSSTATGKRFATALFYIADVAVGGATVFTKLGLSVFPVKNSVMFWWNLDPSGNDDFNTQHAACPVLRGSRWGMKYTPDNSLAYPSEEDVTGMVEGMTRLQLMYDLDVMMMANGTLTTFYSSKPVFIEYTAPMTSCDCYELGLIEYHKKDRSRNIAWMKQALRRHEHGLDCPITKVDIYDRLSGDYYFIGEHEAAKYWIERRVDASPTDPQNKKYKEVLNLLQGMEAINKATPISTPRNKEIDLYPGLCLKTYFSLNASLTCYYAHGPHPFLLVAPMKAERLHQSPEILLFHDVITNAEIQDIQALARPRFEQAKATKQDGTRAASENYCVHQVAWLTDVWSNATLRVARRVAQFSGLVVNANTTEEFQVANYGTGGYYGPHYDFIRSNVSSTATGKRFATALFYIADVAVGGATVFTKLGLSVFPVKNSAMFWWNLDPSGNDDFNKQHAACPVLRGSRWVMSKWISLSGQELIKPCPSSFTKPEEKPTCSCNSKRVFY